jgi:hypothetical protein
MGIRNSSIGALAVSTSSALPTLTHEEADYYMGCGKNRSAASEVLVVVDGRSCQHEVPQRTQEPQPAISARAKTLGFEDGRGLALYGRV